MQGKLGEVITPYVKLELNIAVNSKVVKVGILKPNTTKIDVEKLET